jgi:hypothetical protein
MRSAGCRRETRGKRLVPRWQFVTERVRKRVVANTPYAGRRAGVGYSAVVIGVTRGFCAASTIAAANPCHVVAPVELK